MRSFGANHLRLAHGLVLFTLSQAAPIALPNAVAQVLPDDIGIPSELEGVAGALVSSVGYLTEHRSYEPATPIGPRGFTLGVELTLMKAPKDLISALETVGGGTSGLTVIPIPRLHLHKGLGSRGGFGVSYVRFGNYSVIGGDVKIVFAKPDEGLTWAGRLSYSVATMSFVSTKTWTPALLVSKALDFADPYLGIAYSFVKGSIAYPLEVDGRPVKTLNFDGSGRNFTAFTGVQFNLGLLFVLEGGYSTAGAHWLGTKIGLTL